VVVPDDALVVNRYSVHPLPPVFAIRAIARNRLACHCSL
jgi:hypothetical protein